jgi:hypothetical protein
MKKGALISSCMFVFFLSLPSLLLANEEEELINLLKNAKSLKCSFGDGFYSKWEDGELSTKKNSVDPIIFDSIDFKNGKSRAIGRTGSADVIATLTMGGAHFVETTDSGTWNTTTVFLVYGKKGEDMFQRGLFFAAHSRHVSALLIQPMVSQYYGTCELWNIE